MESVANEESEEKTFTDPCYNPFRTIFSERNDDNMYIY